MLVACRVDARDNYGKNAEMLARDYRHTELADAIAAGFAERQDL